MSWMPQVSEALTPCSWSEKISVSPENYSLVVIEGSVTTSCARPSPEVFLCSVCKIYHILTHTCTNICPPKMRSLPGRTDYLGCYRAGSSQHPLGGASALQYSQTVCWRLWMLFIRTQPGEPEQSWKTGLKSIILIIFKELNHYNFLLFISVLCVALLQYLELLLIKKNRMFANFPFW